MSDVIAKIRAHRDKLAAELESKRSELADLDAFFRIYERYAVPVEPNNEEAEVSAGHNGTAVKMPPELTEHDDPENNGRPWAEQDEEFKRLWHAGTPTREIAKILKRSSASISTHANILRLPPRKTGGASMERRRLRLEPKTEETPPPKKLKSLRRFNVSRALNPEAVKGLDEDHAAIIEKRTLFPSTVVDAESSDRLLVSGVNSSKIGSRVTKGPWSGMPIYMLTLEERATCPESCHHWNTCYGNGMPHARRHKHGPEFILRLYRELAELERKHSYGFVVRLHQLGDFYNLDYVSRWRAWLKDFPALRVFGYTAWPEDTPIGQEVLRLATEQWDRFAVRLSSQEPGLGVATTIWYAPNKPKVAEGIVCPAQTGATDCCGTCGLCWHPNAKHQAIAFVAHGAKSRKFQARTQDPPRLDPKELAAEQASERFDEPKRRRCENCQQIFQSRFWGETKCSSCETRVSA